MKLGLTIGYSGAAVAFDAELVKEAEAMGYDSVWSAEAWGSDAVSPLAWLAAQTSTIKLGTGIMQLPGRSPANTAMTAMTLDALSGGRFILGLGTSGPQVVEGWHGQPWDKPLTWMREYIEIVRKILARDEPVTFEGKRYQLPYRGPGSKGFGKPLKSILHGRRDIPIYTGSMAPKGQALAGEVADGVLLTCMHPERMDVTLDRLAIGFERAGRTAEGFDIAPTVAVVLGDDLERCRAPLRRQLALYIGGMGARNKNFYADYMRAVGFEAEVERIQHLWFDGDKRQCAGAVTDEMIDTFYLVGPADRIRDHFQRWKASGVPTMVVGTPQREAVRLIAELNG
jgi:F420-dependent oxidoreductase-like protein